MITVRDFKGRLYNVLEITNFHTILECIATRDRVTIPVIGWDQIGFLKA